MNRQLVALVTGGNRGLGLETCRRLAKDGYKVILTSRNAQKGKQKVEELNEEGLPINFASLDVSDPKSIAALYQEIKSNWGRLDVLINNAAVLLEKKQEEYQDLEEQIEAHRDILEQTLRTNVIGAYDLCERFIPLMQQHHYGRIVNVSSEAGQLSAPHTYYPIYSISKTALNAITSFLAERVKGTNILINSVCPGWVKTDMGGPDAPRSIEEGVEGIIWAATLPNKGPNGGFFRDGKLIEW